MTKPITRVAIVLDRSGSMSSIRSEAIGSFNDQIKELARAQADTTNYVTLVTFSSFVDEPLYVQTAPTEITALTEENYVPSGGTAMLDGVGKALDILESSRDKDDPNVAFLVVVISDGMENASRDYTSRTLADRIKKLTDTGKWTFAYMGANQDLSQVSKSLNIDYGSTCSFDATASGTRAVTSLHNNAINSYLGARTAGIMSKKNFYSLNPPNISKPFK